MDSECISTGFQNVSLVNIEVHIQALELAKDLFLIYIKQMMIWERRENITSNVKKQEKNTFSNIFSQKDTIEERNISLT